MAVDKMNDSYNRCLSVLRQRYQNRGISSNLNEEATLQAKRGESNDVTASEGYVLFDALVFAAAIAIGNFAFGIKEHVSLGCGDVIRFPTLRL